jgi:hypothetical protein
MNRETVAQELVKIAKELTAFSVDDFEITLADLKSHVRSQSSVVISGKKYRAGLMSYGSYFLEPWGLNLKETDDFPEGTIFLKLKRREPVKFPFGAVLRDQSEIYGVDYII